MYSNIANLGFTIVGMNYQFSICISMGLPNYYKPKNIQIISLDKRVFRGSKDKLTTSGRVAAAGHGEMRESRLHSVTDHGSHDSVCVEGGSRESLIASSREKLLSSSLDRLKSPLER